MASEKAKAPKCTGKRADGRPCKQVPVEGTTRCWHHSFKVPGRPSKLTPELTERVVDAILVGAYLETAAQAVGITPRTLYRWLERGDDAEAAALEHFDSTDTPGLEDLYEHLDPAEWAYLEFRHALKSAEAFAELELLRKVQGGHGRQPWTAYMTVLERKAPARWGRRLEVKHDGNVDLGKPVLHAPDSEEKRRQVAGLLQSAGALDVPDDTTTEQEQ